MNCAFEATIEKRPSTNTEKPKKPAANQPKSKRPSHARPKQSSRTTAGARPEFKGKCHTCHEWVHKSADCPQRANGESRDARGVSGEIVECQGYHTINFVC